MAYDQDLLDDALIAFDKLGWKIIPKDDTASNIWELNGCDHTADGLDGLMPHFTAAPPSKNIQKVCDNCGSRHWQFFADVETRKRWITWLTTPDPAKDKMGKVVHLKPKPDQPA